MLAVMPVFHGFGLGISIHTMLMYAGCCILVPRFTADSYAKLLLKYGGMLAIFLFTASAAAYLCAGRLSDYHALMILSGDLFVCGKDTLAAAIVPALLN